jgi:hypothetical protein
MNNELKAWITERKNVWLFPAFWLLTFIIYFPAARAGWVIDGVGFLYNIRHQSFWDFINRTNSTDQSFYQLFTLHYYLFYKFWGFNVWLWSLLYITVQAIILYLLFIVCRNIFYDSGVKKYILVPLCGVLIFAISPHISEIIICRAYFHYLLSFMFILLIIERVRKFQHEQRSAYLWWAAFLFALSTITLEIFYLLPFFVLSLALYYRYALGYNKKIFYKTLLYVLVPQLLLLGIYFVALLVTFKHFKPHKIELTQSATDYLSKLPKYIFHIVFLGRYFSMAVKEKVYAICESWATIIIVYGLVATTFMLAFRRVNKLPNDRKPAYLLFAWAVFKLLFLLPLAFPGPELLVFYDRYTYFADAFIYVLLVFVISRLVTNKYVAILLFCIYVDVNLYFTIQVNTSWIESNVINTNLLRNLPNAGNKTVLLLNIPENMNGAPMIGSSPEGEFKMMREVYSDTVIANKICDVASYNMTTDYNGAHVTVINDSVVQVALNHGGSWWWYDGHGAVNYETPDYKADFKTVGMRYDLTLKRPADNYLILFSVGDKWKTVDMTLRNKQQD